MTRKAAALNVCTNGYYMAALIIVREYVHLFVVVAVSYIYFTLLYLSHSHKLLYVTNKIISTKMTTKK